MKKPHMNLWNKNIKEILQLYLLFIIAVLVTYTTPHMVSIIFQITLLIVFWYSKKDYFWLAFVFIISSEPGYLFASIDASHSFSLLASSSLGNFYFYLIFIIMAFIKYLHKKIKTHFFLNINFILIFSYFIFQVMAFGVYKMTGAIRMTLPWLLLFIVPRAIKNEKELYGFFRLIFSFVFFVLITQGYKIISGLEFSTLLGGMASEVVAVHGGIEEAETALRPVYGIFIPFIALWGSIYYLTHRNKFINKNYITIILVLSMFSVYLTATRSWLIASLFLALFYIVVSSRSPVKSLTQVTVAALLIWGIMQKLPFLKEQSELSFARFETLEDFANGDITAGGTANRFNVRAKRPMRGFRENPILGWGIGNEFQKYGDGHVGYHNLLMSAGIIGFTFWMLLWGNFGLKMFLTNKRLKANNPYKNIPLLLIAFAGSILIINTTAQWFGYLMGFNTAFAIALLFTLGNRMYYLNKQHNAIFKTSNINLKMGVSNS